MSQRLHFQHLNSGEALGLMGTRPQPSSLPQKLSIKWLVRNIVSKNGKVENTLQSQEANRAGRFLISLFLTWAKVPASSGAWVGGFALGKRGQQMTASWGARPGRNVATE